MIPPAELEAAEAIDSISSVVSMFMLGYNVL
jgi:hypothetical protein